MIAATSKPARVAIVLAILLVIYFFQPFSSGISSKYTDRLQQEAAAWSPFKEGLGDKAKHPPSGTPEAMFETNEGGPRMRQATMIYDSDKYNAAYERSVNSHIEHGNKFNIPTHVLRHDIVEAGFFNKPAFLLGLVIQEMAKPYGQRADWIVWFDADTIVVNPEVPWSVFLPPPEYENIHVLGSKDQNGFNAGMMILRVHDWTVKMLSEVLSVRQLRPEVEFLFEDQGATKWVIERPGYEEHVLYQPHDWWNAFGLAGQPYNTNRFNLHFAGVDCCGSPDKKTVIMSRWLDIVENHPEKYTLDLANTTYPAEIEDYWKRLKIAKNTLKKAEKKLGDGKNKSPELEAAQVELRNTIMREADSFEKISTANQVVETILSGKKFDAAPAAKPA